jgi:hypothetical protein
MRISGSGTEKTKFGKTSVRLSRLDREYAFSAIRVPEANNKPKILKTFFIEDPL